MARTRLHTRIYGSPTIFKIVTDTEINQLTLEAIRAVPGVKDAFSDRYEVRVFVGECFDAMEVATTVRHLIEEAND